MTVRGVGFLALLLLVLAQAPAAWGHASLVRAEPADGVLLAQPPATLRLTFNEPVSPFVIRLLGPGGEAIPLAVAAENTTVILTPALLGQGSYVLSWRVTSADGHPVGGSLLFSVGAPSAPPGEARRTAGDAGARAALWASKVAIYLGLIVGIGGALFGAWIGNGSTRRSTAALVVVTAAGLVATVLSIGLQGLDALDLPLPALVQEAVWKAGLRTSYGSTAIAAAVALSVGLTALLSRAQWTKRGLSLLALIGVGLALSLSGHATTAEPPLLTQPSVFLHGICAALWVGSLLPLILTLRTGGGRALARFSRVIPYPLAALVVTGAALAFVQLDRFDALWTTSYGLVLSGKLAAVLVLLVLAAVNRYMLVPRFQAAGAAAARPLVATMAIEFAIALAVLALVAFWRFTPPPRALALAGPQMSVHFHGERAMAQIEFAPVRARGAHVNVMLLDGDLRPLAATEVTLTLSNPAAGIEPFRRAAIPAGDALWRVDDLRIPIAGRWRLRVELLLGDFDKVVLDDEVELPRLP